MLKSVESMFVRLRSLSSSIIRFSLHHVKELIVSLCRHLGSQNESFILFLILYRVVYATDKFLSRLLA